MTKKALATYFDDPKHVPDRFNRIEQCHVFPDGWASAICTNWMRYAARILGRDRVDFQGFECNGSAIAHDYFGHDFAVVDGRYIVDGWVVHVACMHPTAVLDLEDPSDAEAIERLYGPRSTWIPHKGTIREDLDAETPKQRAKAMRGVKAFSA